MCEMRYDVIIFTTHPPPTAYPLSIHVLQACGAVLSSSLLYEAGRDVVVACIRAAVAVAVLRVQQPQPRPSELFTRMPQRQSEAFSRLQQQQRMSEQYSSHP